MDRLPDELVTASNDLAQQTVRFGLTAYSKGIRDGLQAAASISGATADRLRERPDAPAYERVIFMLEQLRDQLTTGAFDLPATEDMLAAFYRTPDA